MSLHYAPVTNRTMCGQPLGPKTLYRFDLDQWFHEYTYANDTVCEHCTRKMRRWVQFNNRFRVADQMRQGLRHGKVG